MKQLFIIINLLLLSAILHSQEVTNERVYAHLDKDCYLAGENIWIKLYVVDPDFVPSNLSRVGYIEICDTEKPFIQYKVALEDGRGAGKMRIPETIPTGIYELSAYTRYMRNESKNVFFKRQIAIVNMMQQETDNNRVELVPDRKKNMPVKLETIRVTSDRNAYRPREAVRMSLGKLPENVTDMVVSVVRNDSIVSLPAPDHNSWKTIVRTASAATISGDWLPEYEGHIINGKLVATTGNEIPEHSRLEATLGFVGKDIRVLSGGIDKETDQVSFYTNGVYSRQEIVTSLLVDHEPKGICRVDVTSPFAGELPSKLPVLPISAEDNRLLDRFVGMQLNQILHPDSVWNFEPAYKLYNFKPIMGYDLDEYTRFNSVRQTIIEFIPRVVVRKVDGNSRLKVFFEKERRFNNGSTLVLLDGVPLFNHDYILNYNPYLIKRIDIYEGKYVMGGDFFDCIVEFTTYRGNLPSIQLGNDSQLVVYDCPELPVAFDQMPDYSDEAVKASTRPDFRHTLYWEAFAENRPDAPLEFYTSDLTGEYKIVVEGITRDGNSFYGTCRFNVNE